MNEQHNDSIRQYSMEEQMLKQPAQPLREYTFVNNLSSQPNPQKYTNPPYPNQQLDDSPLDGQNSSLTSAQSTFISKKQRAKILRQRAGLLTDQPPRKLKQPHKKWGNFLVIHDGSFSVTLGPDYWCFIPTFICFTIVSIAILVLIFTKTQSLIIKLSGIIVCGGQLLSYLMMAISNPGIAKEEEDIISLDEYQNPQKSQPMKMCTRCGFSVPRSSFHCRDCDICILGYDHHCPWTSKCIGKNNLCRFYTFLAWTPVFLVYVSIAFVMIMSEQASITHRKNIRSLFQP